MLYFGGPVIAILTTSTLFLNSGAEVLTNYWMSRWVDNTDKDTTSNASYYLWIYIGLTFLTEMIEGVKFYAFIRGSWFAAKRLHGELIRAVMDVSLDWFRTNPVDRVINRLSGDISTLDQDLVNSVIFLLGATIRCLFMGGTVTTILPVFFVPAIVLCVVGGLISIVYNRTAGLLKQLVSSSQSPVLSDFSEGLGGMMVIRAMNKMPGVFSAKMNRLLYTSARATVAQIDTEQWLKFRINTLAALINVSAALLALMQRDKISAGLAGFCLSQATTLSDMILYIVFDISDLNIQMQAVSCFGNRFVDSSLGLLTVAQFHRVREYGQLEPEEKSAEKQQNPEAYSDNVERAISPNWPSSGTVEFRNVTIRYSEDGPDVLRNINFKFNAGERVAVVGRTGSGKSTVSLSITTTIESPLTNLSLSCPSFASPTLYPAKSSTTV
jgi:ABC-type multidrug transport system fused ATPase/permease subunit